MMTKLKDQASKLLKSGFIYIFGSSVINKAIGFLSTIILLRVISKSDYGIFTYAWNIFSIVLLFSGLGFESGSMQVLSENKNDPDIFESVYQYSVKFGMKFNVILVLAVLFITLFISLPIAGSKNVLGILCILPEFMFVFGIQSTYLRCKLKNKKYAVLSVINTSSLMILTVIGAYLFNVYGIAFSYYSAYSLAVFVGYFILKIPLPKKNAKNINSEQKRELIKISVISMLNNSLSHLLYLTDVFVIGLVMTSEVDVAVYKTATQIPTALTFIPLSIIIFAYPYFASNRANKNWCLEKFKQILAILGLFNLVISIFLIIFAEPIIKLVFGLRYLDAVTPFRILSASYFVQGTFRIIAGNLLVTQRRLIFNTMEGVISGLINIIADYILILNYGINGAAIATVIVMAVSGILNTGYLIFVLKKGDGEKNE